MEKHILITVAFCSCLYDLLYDGGFIMAVTLFINSFLSYLMLLLLIVVVIGVAVFIGITLAKKKNEKNNVNIADGGKAEGVVQKTQG
jgi:uncharacterized membrane protein